jgi:hypothetical protein
MHNGLALSTSSESAPIAHLKSTPTEWWFNSLKCKYEIRDDCTVLSARQRRHGRGDPPTQTDVVSWAAGYGLGAYWRDFGEKSKTYEQLPVFLIFMSCIFKINFCRWWGLELFILFYGALGNEIKKFMCHGGKKFFFKMGGCRFWKVPPDPPTPPYIYFWNSP